MWNSFGDESLSDRDSLAFLGTLRFLLAEDAKIDWAGAWTENHSRPFHVAPDVASLIDAESCGMGLDGRARIDVPAASYGLALRSLTAVQE